VAYVRYSYVIRIFPCHIIKATRSSVVIVALLLSSLIVSTSTGRSMGFLQSALPKHKQPQWTNPWWFNKSSRPDR